MAPAATALKKPASQTRRSAKTVSARGNVSEFRALEERDRMRDAEFNHLAERTRTAAEAGVQIGIARMETGVQGRLVGT